MGQFGTVFDDRTSNSIDESALFDLTHYANVRQFGLTSRVFYGDYTYRGVQLYPTELDMGTDEAVGWRRRKEIRCMRNRFRKPGTVATLTSRSTPLFHRPQDAIGSEPAPCIICRMSTQKAAGPN